MVHVNRRLKMLCLTVLSVVIFNIVYRMLNVHGGFRAATIVTDRMPAVGFSTSASSTPPSNLRSLTTTFECVGLPYNHSCLFKNLYYKDGEFWAVSLKQSNLSLPGVRVAALQTTDYRPNHRVFDSEEELHRFAHHTMHPKVLPGLTVHFKQLWHGNIGHALFDGLYPAYVAVIRFAPRHLHPFRVLVGFDRAECPSCFSEDVYNRFAGLGMITQHVANPLSSHRWFVFEEIILGSGMMCQRCIQSNYQLAGGVELNGSRLFRDRMYRQHGLLPPDVRRHPATPINAYIIYNKRFTAQEVEELRTMMDELNRYTDMHMNKSIAEIKSLPHPLVRVHFVNYRNMTANNNAALHLNTTGLDRRSATYDLVDNDFVAQLRILRKMDIHITGPGTGQMYQTFLSDGSVTINLGGMNPYQKETTPIAYPSFMEQYVTAGTPYIRGLYYPINKRRDGIKAIEVTKLVQQAARLIMDGFVIPVNPKENLAPDGQVFVDQCANDKDFCELVTIRKSGQFWCNNMWTEDLVHERRQWFDQGGNDTPVLRYSGTPIGTPVLPPILRYSGTSVLPYSERYSHTPKDTPILREILPYSHTSITRKIERFLLAVVYDRK